MARAPLSDVFLQSRLRERIRTRGTCYVYYPGTTTEASVYTASTGTTTITQPLTFNVVRDALPGYVDVGEYDLSSGGKTQSVDVSAGDAQTSVAPSDPFVDPSLTVFNFPYHQCTAVGASTTTSQTAKFVRIVPTAKITAAKVLSVAGTAIATITGSFVGLYTTDGTTLTRVAVNATNTSSGLWDTNNTAYRQALSPATNVLYPGQTYFVGMLVNATTAGTHAGYAKPSNMPALATTELGSPPMYTLATQTSLPTSQAISGLTAAYDLVPWVGIQ
jgi:hypothetical protein